MDNLVERWGELEVIEGKTFDNNTSWIPKYSQHYKDCIFTKLELEKFSYNGLVIENCAFQNCKIQDFFWTESDILRTKFVSCSISFGHFGDVLFEKVEFIGCWEILEVRFGGCEINEVSFTDCDFSYSRIEPIIGKGKMHFKFDKTKLYYSFFKNVDLTRSSISDCSMIQTTFSNCRLKNSTILSNNNSPEDNFCSIDLQSILLSDSLSPKVLETNFGIWNSDIKDYIMDLTTKVSFQSVFISYSFKDRKFANRLNESLNQYGVFTFLFEKDAPGGKRLKDIMTEGVNDYDRLLFISSENSLRSVACQYELTQGRRKQEKTWNTIFYPIHIDNYLFEVQKDHIRPKKLQDEYWENIEELRELNSLDFSEFNMPAIDQSEFKNKVGLLIKELRKAK